MDITVYLPDETGRKAKESGLNLSALLRQAVQKELHRLDVVGSVGGVKEVEIELFSEHGEPYLGRFNGTLLGEAEGELEAYLTDDERVIIYDPDKLEYWVYDADDEDEIVVWLNGFPDDVQISIMAQLGFRASIEL